MKFSSSFQLKIIKISKTPTDKPVLPQYCYITRSDSLSPPNPEGFSVNNAQCRANLANITRIVEGNHNRDRHHSCSNAHALHEWHSCNTVTLSYLHPHTTMSSGDIFQDRKVHLANTTPVFRSNFNKGKHSTCANAPAILQYTIHADADSPPSFFQADSPQLDRGPRITAT